VVLELLTLVDIGIRPQGRRRPAVSQSGVTSLIRRLKPLGGRLRLSPCGYCFRAGSISLLGRSRLCRMIGAEAILKPLPRTRWRDMLLAHMSYEIKRSAELVV